MTVAFLCIVSILIFLQYKKENNRINLISVLMAPYLVIVLFNNFFFYKFGFYKIEDKTLLIYSLAFIIFFVGARLAYASTFHYTVTIDSRGNLESYNVRKMKNFLYVVFFIGLTKLLFAVKTGRIISEEGYMGKGFVGHLLAFSMALVPIVFLYWTYNKKKMSYLLAVIGIATITFSSFIKYNVISLVVIVFLFLSMNRKEVVKRAVILLVLIVFIIFIGNYAIGFYLQNASVQSSFYLYHFWKYCGGALINANNYYNNGFVENIGIFYKLMIYLCALPNMFLSLVNERVFGWEEFDFSTHVIAKNGQSTNVIDAVTRLFPSHGDILEVFLWVIVIFFIGFIFMRIYLKEKKKALSTVLPIFLTYFVFFSFFGTFYMQSGPWETLVWAILVPRFFIKKMD